MPSSTSNSSSYYPLPKWAPVSPLKLLIAALMFAAIWFAGDRFGGYLLSKLIDQSHFRYTELYRGGAEHDYIVFGNSRGVNTFHTPSLNKATGLKGINLSYNGLDPQTIETLYNDYLLHNKAPKVLLLEISNLGQSPNTLATLKPFLGKSDALDAQHRTHYRTSNNATRLSHLFRFNSELYYRILYYLMGNDQDWINRYKINPAVAEDYILPADQRDRFDKVSDESLAYLSRIIATSNEHGVEVYLIVGPYLPGYIDQMPNYDQWLKTIEEHTGLTVLDLSNSLQSIEFFADPIHTNINSVKDINALLIEDIFSQSRPRGQNMKRAAEGDF